MTIEEKERELEAAALKFKTSAKDGQATFEICIAAWKAMRPDAGLLFKEVEVVLKKILN